MYVYVEETLNTHAINTIGFQSSVLQILSIYGTQTTSVTELMPNKISLAKDLCKAISLSYQTYINIIKVIKAHVLVYE